MKTVKKSIKYYFLNFLFIITFSFVGVNAQIDKSVESLNSAPIAMPKALNEVAMDVAAKVSVAAVQNSDFIPITMVG